MRIWIKALLPILTIAACCSCGRRISQEEDMRRSFRALNFGVTLQNDKIRIENDLLEKDIAELEGKRWHREKFDQDCLIEQNDLIRAHIDQTLEGFPTLPRIPVDDFADQLDAQTRATHSLQEARKFNSQLVALEGYVFSLREPSADQFLAEIAQRSTPHR